MSHATGSEACSFMEYSVCVNSDDIYEQVVDKECMSATRLRHPLKKTFLTHCNYQHAKHTTKSTSSWDVTLNCGKMVPQLGFEPITSAG